MTNKLAGVFQITQWDENTHLEFKEGSKHNYAKIKQAYSGDIVGESNLQYIMNYMVNGEATFNGFESINATIGNKTGRIVIEHRGKFVQGIASSNFNVISESCSDDFVHTTGNGTFTSTENGQAKYHFELSFARKG